MRLRSVATLCLCIALVGLCVAQPGLAVSAAELITGRDIKNNSVTTKDIKDGSLRQGDFKTGQLPAGPQGQPGPTGPQGPPGGGNQPAFYTWTWNYTSDGVATTASKVSNSSIAGPAEVVAVDHDITGAFLSQGGCGVDISLDTGVRPYQLVNFFKSVGEPLDTYEAPPKVVTVDNPVLLRGSANCPFGGDAAMPSFQASVTFAVTQVPIVSPQPFN